MLMKTNILILYKNCTYIEHDEENISQEAKKYLSFFNGLYLAFKWGVHFSILLLFYIS